MFLPAFAGAFRFAVGLPACLPDQFAQYLDAVGRCGLRFGPVGSMSSVVSPESTARPSPRHCGAIWTSVGRCGRRPWRFLWVATCERARDAREHTPGRGFTQRIVGFVVPWRKCSRHADRAAVDQYGRQVGGAYPVGVGGNVARLTTALRARSCSQGRRTPPHHAGYAAGRIGTTARSLELETSRRRYAGLLWNVATRGTAGPDVMMAGTSQPQVHSRRASCVP